MATLIRMPTAHLPVLAPELIALTAPEPGDVVVDATFGGGGHARLAADRIGPTGTLIAIDRDPAAAARFAALEPELGCEARFEAGDFADVLDRLAADGLRANVVYMDLGVSSMQLDNADRGFSYASDAPLDMRMDTEPGAHGARDRQRVARRADRRDAPRARRGAPCARDRVRDRAPPAARNHL